MTRSMQSYVGAAISNSAPGYVTAARGVSDALKAVLTQTADTGQVNWATVTTTPPATTGTTPARDYEIYRFNDSLQATKPIFIKIEYGKMSTTNTTVSVFVTVGTSTDGAGNLGGITVPRATICSGQSLATGSQLNTWASSDGSYLSLAVNVNLSTATQDPYAGAVVIDRTRNPGGAITGEGYMVLLFTDSTWGGMYMRYTNAFSTSQPALDFQLPLLLPGLKATQSAFFGETTYAFPVYSYAPLLQGASIACLVAFPGDLPRASDITLPVNNVNQTWVAMGSAMSLNTAYMNTATQALVRTLSPIFRWE